jgi:hypothetical protein
VPFDVIYGNILPFWGWVFIASVVILVRRKETATTVDRDGRLMGVDISPEVAEPVGVIGGH